jgi:hypothetical protein
VKSPASAGLFFCLRRLHNRLEVLAVPEQGLTGCLFGATKRIPLLNSFDTLAAACGETPGKGF